MIHAAALTAALAAALTATLAAALTSGCKSERKGPAQVPAQQPVDDAGATVMPHRVFASATEALVYILERNPANAPRIIGIGELHQTYSSAPVKPTIERFIELLDLLAPRAADLVVETWVESGACGAKEQATVADVRATTERPQVIETHLTRLWKGAVARAIEPHMLAMDCADYDALMGDAGVDYERLLVLIGRKLAQTATHAWTARQAEASERRTLVLYGGALHNDLYPIDGLDTISYAAELERLAAGAYIEVDLYVPEYMATNHLVTMQPWYSLVQAKAGPDHVLVIEPAPRSYVVVLRTGETPGAAQAPAVAPGLPAAPAATPSRSPAGP